MNLAQQIKDQELYNIIKEFLKYNQFFNTFECFDAEIKTKIAKNDLNKIIKSQKSIGGQESEPKLYEMQKGQQHKNTRELNLEVELKQEKQNYKVLQEASKQIMAIGIKQIQNWDELAQKIPAELLQNVQKSIELFKQQYCKYVAIIYNDNKNNEAELISEDNLLIYKNQLKEWQEKINGFNAEEKESQQDVEINIKKLLLKIRINGIKIGKVDKTKFINNLVKVDFFSLEEDPNYVKMCNFIKNIKSFEVLQLAMSIFSMLLSNKLGMDYLYNDNKFEILKEFIYKKQMLQMGSVSQRFFIAILQKSSILNEVGQIYYENNIIDYIFEVLEASFEKDINEFCPEYASAALSNILNTSFILDHLNLQKEIAKTIYQKQIKYLLNENLKSVATITHLLMSLSTLFKLNDYQELIQQIEFKQSISQFIYNLEKNGKLFKYYYFINFTKDSFLKYEKQYLQRLCKTLFDKKSEEEQQLQDEMEGKNPLENEEELILNNKETLEKFNNMQLEVVFEQFLDEIYTT